MPTKRSLFFTILLIPLFCFSANKRPDKPNVILILTDDLGWQDVKCYDIDKPNPYETPNIDQLAKEGVMFWQGYSPAPTCSPSRGAIISGKHPARLQRTHVVGGAPPMPYRKTKTPIICPWYSGRLSTSETTIATELNNNGYYTGHVGKWHIAIDHKAYPQPKDHGFQFTRSNIGVTSNQKPHRLTDFATSNLNDPYRLDENGYPFDQNNADALMFLDEAKSKPFFLYYATWLVHTPIHTRSEALLKKYCQKLGLEYPKNPDVWNVKGQKNPYYAAMIEMLDYYVGTIFTYLKETEDPRWKGHKLIENTYIIFSSDNGGMEGKPNEIITDNYPLDKGKINAKEGGTRVPYIITGPHIPQNVQSDVMVNGLDFYPTILGLTKSKVSKDKLMDGADLTNLLTKNPKDPKLVIDPLTKEVRNTMVWHFPHSSMQTTIRKGDYKLIRNFLPNKPPLELYKLYKNGSTRNDIEEMNNLVKNESILAEKLNNQLQNRLTEMQASFPFKNPHYHFKMENKEMVPSIINHEQNSNKVQMTFKENGAKVVKAQIIYTNNGGQKYEEWYRLPATLKGNKVIANLPKGTTHYIFNIIDENQFLVSYPSMGDIKDYKEKKYSINALTVK